MKKSNCFTWVLCPLVISMASINANADFIDESKLNLELRNYYYNNDYREGHTGTSKTEEWGQAFRLFYQSGYTEGKFQFGLDAMALLGVKLDSGGGRHQGGSMLVSDGDGVADYWTRLGATLKMKVSDTEVRLGTLRPQLPILIANDGRLLPQTFQGGMVTVNEFDNLTLTAGRLNRTTGRASSDRVGLAVAGGLEESDAFYFAGGDYRPGGGPLTLQYYHASLEDYYRQNFAGAVHNWQIADDHALKTDLRYFRTRGQGANSSGELGYQVGGFTRDGNGEIDNDTWSATFLYSTAGHGFLVGYQSVSDGSNFVQLNQGSLDGDKGSGGASLYLYTDRYASSFMRAGQETRYAQYSYDFNAVGIPGLSAFIMYLDSDGIRTADGRAEEAERDVGISYAVQNGPMKGLRMAWVNGKLDSDVVSDRDQHRLIFNYTLSLL